MTAGRAQAPRAAAVDGEDAERGRSWSEGSWGGPVSELGARLASAGTGRSPSPWPPASRCRCPRWTTAARPSASDGPMEMSTEEIFSLIKEGGVVGLGGAGFPTHAKLNARDKKIDEIIVNCAECEPYLTSDQVAIDSYPEKVIIGLKIAMKVMNASKGYFGIEN